MSANDQPGDGSSVSAHGETIAVEGQTGHANTVLAPSSTDVGEAVTGIAPPSTRIGMGHVRGSSGVTSPPLGGASRDRRASLLPLHDLDAEGGRYRVGEQIGQGGMGEVLVAHDEQIGRDVAVKRMRASEPSNEERARFVREARVQGRLEHPAVVPVHDLGVDRDGRPFFVMKRLTGVTLASLITSQPTDPDGARRSQARLLRAFVDVCLAVEFAHQRSIIHRDLKPANIMLGDYGEVYVLDWGVARAVGSDNAIIEPSPSSSISMISMGSSSASSSRPRPAADDLQLDSGETREGTVLGTPGYMAPEQLGGERSGPAADIYALGCILFEISAGEALHPRGSGALASTAIGADARPSLRRADAAPELDAICVRATELDPSARFASARALADAVQEFLDGDRDIELRRQLAKSHVKQARAELAAGDDEQHRRAAMREAGRALALDPMATPAAELITRLMLSPPRVVPDEVERRLNNIDVDMGRAQGRTAAIALVGYLGFVPLLIWTGVRDWRYVGALVALALINAGVVLKMTRFAQVSLRGIYTSLVLNAFLIAIVARMVGPFLIAPTLAATTLIAYSSHPKFGRLRVVGPVLASGVIIPWLLDFLGVLPPSYHFIDGKLVMSSDVLRFTSAPVQVAFAAMLVVLLGMVSVLSRDAANKQRLAAQQLEVQAWQLRQLVTSDAEAGTASESGSGPAASRH